MDAERWKHVERVLQSALDVRALPRSAGAAGTFLSGPAIGVAAKAAARHPARSIGGASNLFKNLPRVGEPRRYGCSESGRAP